MTTIATDGRTMASDGRASRRGTIVSEVIEKVRKLDDGRILGVSGTLDDMEAAVRWFNEGGDKPKIDENTSLLLLTAAGASIYESNLLAQPCALPVAIGSGMDLAIGAMEAGRSPTEAVEIAARRDTDTGGTITELSL